MEITTFRVAGIGRTFKPTFRTITPGVPVTRPSRRVFDVQAHDWFEVQVLDWESIEPGAVFDGPLVIEHPTTTVYVASAQTVGMDDIGNLLITPKIQTAGVAAAFAQAQA
jgi:N-methylhydantoinase A